MLVLNENRKVEDFKFSTTLKSQKGGNFDEIVESYDEVEEKKVALKIIYTSSI